MSERLRGGGLAEGLLVQYLWERSASIGVEKSKIHGPSPLSNGFCNSVGERSDSRRIGLHVHDQANH